jgi:fumarate hydratase subunit alpha
VIRELSVSVLRDTIAKLLPDINFTIPPDVLAALRQAALREESDLGRQTLQQLVRNYEVAAEERMPVCQDSGMTV